MQIGNHDHITGREKPTKLFSRCEIQEFSVSEALKNIAVFRFLGAQILLAAERLSASKYTGVKLRNFHFPCIIQGFFFFTSIHSS